MNQKYLRVGIALLAIVIVIALTLSFFAKPKFHGAMIDPPYAAPDFTLTDQRGADFRLSDRRGSITLLFFGFTNCTDECPLTLANFRLAAEALGADADKLRFVMITTDPVRDTPEVLAAFVAQFNPAFLGLTGSSAALEQVYKDYGVVVMDGGTTHSTRIYVIDQAGNLRATYSSDMNPADLIADLRLFLKGY
jgi:protein SCO1/2